MIPDPDVSKPEDWDDDDGEWKPKMIDNPDYKGPWEHPKIANPDFFEDDEIYNVCNPCDSVGFELWQVTAGSIFDNILVTDDIALAKSEAEEIIKRMALEKEAFNAAEDARRKAEEEKREKEKLEREALDAISKPPAGVAEEDLEYKGEDDLKQKMDDFEKDLKKKMEAEGLDVAADVKEEL